MANTPISEDTIKKIATLARLELTATETSLYSKQLGAIVDYVSDLAKLDTTGVEPLITPTAMPYHFRTDEVKPGLGAEGVTSNAPDKSGHLFKVPAVL